MFEEIECGNRHFDIVKLDEDSFLGCTGFYGLGVVPARRSLEELFEFCLQH